jgi:hypothetical protein
LVIGRGEERFAPGVLCFDLAIQPGKIVELAHKVDDGGIVDVALLRMVGDDTFKVDDGWQTHRGDVDALMGSNDWKDYLAKGTDSSEKFQVRPVGDSGWFMLPAGRDNSVATFFALRPRGAFIQRPSYWFAVGICGAVSAVVLLVGASQSRRLSYTQGQLARLRSLQVGAIETDGSQRIVAINDRAQEILLFEGRQFGLDRGPTPLFDVIFDTGQMIRAQSMALDRPGRKAGEGPYIPTSLRDWRPEANGERLTFDDVARERARGRTSAYFVPIKRIKTEQARWVLVIASPVVGAKLTGRWRARNFASLDATFGVIEPITDQTLLYQLDQIRGNRK